MLVSYTQSRVYLKSYVMQYLDMFVTSRHVPFQMIKRPFEFYIIIVIKLDVCTFLHCMVTSSNGNIFRVTGHFAGNSPVTCEFPAQRPVTRSFDVFFDLRLNKRLSKQSWGWWFETPSCPLWRHYNCLWLEEKMTTWYIAWFLRHYWYIFFQVTGILGDC